MPDEWYFVDTADEARAKKEKRDPKTMGPVNIGDIGTLLESGVLVLTSKVRKEGDEKGWRPLQEHEDLADLVNARKVAISERWYYENEYQKICGPISIGELLFKYTEGLIGK